MNSNQSLTTCNDKTMARPNLATRMPGTRAVRCRWPWRVRWQPGMWGWVMLVNMYKFLSYSFQLSPVGNHFSLALRVAQRQGANPSSPSLAVAYRRDITETISEISTIRYNFLILNSDLISAHSQEKNSASLLLKHENRFITNSRAWGIYVCIYYNIQWANGSFIGLLRLPLSSSHSRLQG